MWTEGSTDSMHNTFKTHICTTANSRIMNHPFVSLPHYESLHTLRIVRPKDQKHDASKTHLFAQLQTHAFFVIDVFYFILFFACRAYSGIERQAAWCLLEVVPVILRLRIHSVISPSATRFPFSPSYHYHVSPSLNHRPSSLNPARYLNPEPEGPGSRALYSRT